jgi:hypothetical protein
VEPNPSARIDELIANTPDFRGATIARLREIFHAADPDIVEEWKWMGSPVFSHNGIVGVITLLKNKVKLTFSEGAKLADPDKVFNNGLDGGKWRAIDIDEYYVIDEAKLIALIRSGIAYNIAKSQSAAKAKSAKKQAAQ